MNIGGGGDIKIEDNVGNEKEEDDEEYYNNQYEKKSTKGMDN